MFSMRAIAFPEFFPIAESGWPVIRATIAVLRVSSPSSPTFSRCSESQWTSVIQWYLSWGKTETVCRLHTWKYGLLLVTKVSFISKVTRWLCASKPLWLWTREGRMVIGLGYPESNLCPYQAHSTRVTYLYILCVYAFQHSLHVHTQ